MQIDLRAGLQNFRKFKDIIKNGELIDGHQRLHK